MNDHDPTADLPAEPEDDTGFADYLRLAGDELDRDFPPSVVEDSLRRILHDAAPPGDDATGPQVTHHDTGTRTSWPRLDAAKFLKDTEFSFAPIDFGFATGKADAFLSDVDTRLQMDSFLAMLRRRIEEITQAAQLRAGVLEDAALAKAGRIVADARRQADDILSQARREAVAITAAAAPQPRHARTPFMCSVFLPADRRPVIEVLARLAADDQPPHNTQRVAGIGNHLHTRMAELATPLTAKPRAMRDVLQVAGSPCEVDIWEALLSLHASQLQGDDWPDRSLDAHGRWLMPEIAFGDQSVMELSWLRALRALGSGGRWPNFEDIPGRIRWRGALKLLRQEMRPPTTNLLVVSYLNHGALAEAESALSPFDVQKRSPRPPAEYNPGQCASALEDVCVTP